MSKKQTQKQKQLIQYLQEDQDDFQQFQGGIETQRKVQKIDNKMWQEDWDDQDLTDDFTVRHGLNEQDILNKFRYRPVLITPAQINFCSYLVFPSVLSQSDVYIFSMISLNQRYYYFNGQVRLLKSRPAYTNNIIKDILSKTLHKNRYIDIATGTGQLLFKIAPFFKFSIGLDKSNKMIDTCKSSQQFIKMKQSIQLRVNSWQNGINQQEQLFDLITIGQALHWLDKQKFYQSVKKNLKENGKFVITGYYPLGISFKGGQEKWCKKGFDIYNKFHDFLRPYYDFDRKDLQYHYPQQKYNITKYFRQVQRNSQLVQNDVSLEYFVKYKKTSSAYNVYVQKYGKDPVIEFIKDCQNEGVLLQNIVTQHYSYFWIVCQK